MGARSEEALDLEFDNLADYLRGNHAAYMEVNGKLYYLTDVDKHYWRAQDTDKLNEKGHYCDCSEIVTNLDEFVNAVPVDDGKTIADVFEDATFYASV